MERNASAFPGGSNPHLTLLERGIEGDIASRALYLSRPFAYASLPAWVHTQVGNMLQEHLRYHARLAAPPQVVLRQSKKGIVRKTVANKRFAANLSTYWSNVSAWFNSMRTFGHAFHVADEMAANPGESHFVRVNAADAARYAVRANALIDFLTIHPLPLKDAEKNQVALEAKSVWEVPNHPLVKQLLDSDALLQEVFGRLAVPTEYRLKSIRRHASGKQDVDAIELWLEGQLESTRPKSVSEPPARPVPAESNGSYGAAVKHHVSRFLVSEYPRLAGSALHGAVNAVLHLDVTRTLGYEDAIARIRKEKPADPAGFISSLHDALLSKPVRAGRPPREPPSGKGQPPDSGNRPPPKPEETVDEVLARLDQGGKMTLADRKTLRDNLSSLDKAAALRALKHEVLFYVATGGSVPGVHKPHRVRFDSLSPGNKHLPSHPLLPDAVKQLVRENSIVHRENGRRPELARSPVKVHPKLLPQYGHGS